MESVRDARVGAVAIWWPETGGSGSDSPARAHQERARIEFARLVQIGAPAQRAHVYNKN